MGDMMIITHWCCARCHSCLAWYVSVHDWPVTDEIVTASLSVLCATDLLAPRHYHVRQSMGDLMV